MKGLEILVNKIGKKPAQRFLKLAQTQLEEDHQQLLQHLHAKEWQKAADKAHYLKATANLYASETLLKYYGLIVKNKPALQQNTLFIEALNQELKRVEKNIQLFLEKEH